MASGYGTQLRKTSAPVQLHLAKGGHAADASNARLGTANVRRLGPAHGWPR